MSFDRDFLKGIDLNLAASQQYGSGSVAVKNGNHAWHWQAKLPDGSLRGLDMNLAAQRQMSPTAKAVMLGAGAYDWSFIDFPKIDKKVIPIILVTADKIYDIAAVAEAVECYKTKIIGVQEWLRQEIGKTFDSLPPLIGYTNITDQQIQAWNPDVYINKTYFTGMTQAVDSYLGSSRSMNHMYLSTVFSTTHMTGAACTAPHAVVRSHALDDRFNIFDALSYTRTSDSADDMYVVAHELLHSFGLDHPPEGTVNRDQRIMWTGRLPNAVLTAEEKSILLRSAFLK